MDEMWSFVIVQDVLFFRLTHTRVLQTEKKLSTLRERESLFMGFLFLSNFLLISRCHGEDSCGW